MSYEILGIDVSRYQGTMDYYKAVDTGARFVACRVTVGDYYVDTQFPRSWDAAVQAGLKVSGYHVVRPDRPAVNQIDHLFNQLGGRLEDFPLVLDCEVPAGQTRSRITQVIFECADQLRRETGNWPLIYTNWNFWNNYTLYRPEWVQMPLWVADYTTRSRLAGYPTWMPRDWQSWIFWQYSADGNGLGAAFGAQSYSIDLNHFYGSEVDWLAFVGDDAPPPPPPVVEATMLKVDNQGYSYLPLRTGGQPTAPEVGQMPNGEMVTLLEVAPPRATGEVWVRVMRQSGQSGWCAYYYSNNRKMLVVNG